MKRARAPARQAPYPERKASRYSTKLHRYEVHTRVITRDHVPRRADQCNLHTHVIANNNKSPVENAYMKRVFFLGCS